jgi:hypothetical protein
MVEDLCDEKSKPLCFQETLSVRFERPRRLRQAEAQELGKAGSGKTEKKSTPPLFHDKLSMHLIVEELFDQSFGLFRLFLTQTL